jgi:hypothetical protein
MVAEPVDTAVKTPEELMVAVFARIHHDDTVVSDTEVPSE